MNQKRMNWIRTGVFFIEVAVIIMVIAASVYTVFIDRSSFFSITAAQALTLIVAVCITFHATQYKSDERKVKEQVERITEKIQTVSMDRNLYLFKEDDDPEIIRPQTMMICKKLSNCIDVFEQYANICGLEKDAQYLRQEFSAYDTLVSDKINDPKYLSKSGSILRKHLQNIDSRCDQIVANIYIKSEKD